LRALLESDVENKSAVEVGDDDFFHALVFGVGKVGIATGLAIEAHDEAVGEFFIEVFLIVIVVTAEDLEETGDFSGHAAHLIEAVGDLGIGDSVFELEHSEVFYLAHIDSYIPYGGVESMLARLLYLFKTHILLALLSQIFFNL
jgi:hypothetical protein